MHIKCILNLLQFVARAGAFCEARTYVLTRKDKVLRNCNVFKIYYTADNTVCRHIDGFL